MVAYDNCVGDVGDDIDDVVVDDGVDGVIV